MFWKFLFVVIAIFFTVTLVCIISALHMGKLSGNSALASYAGTFFLAFLTIESYCIAFPRRRNPSQ